MNTIIVHLFHIKATFVDSFENLKEFRILADLAAGLPRGAGGGVVGHDNGMQCSGRRLFSDWPLIP